MFIVSHLWWLFEVERILLGVVVLFLGGLAEDARLGVLHDNMRCACAPTRVPAVGTFARFSKCGQATICTHAAIGSVLELDSTSAGR